MTQAGSAVTFQNPEPFQNDNELPSKSHLLEAGNGDILELEQVGPDQCVVDRDGEQNPERMSNASRSSIPDHQRDAKAMLHEEEKVPDLEAQRTKREIHLVTPLTMIAALFIGFFMAIGHHLYYHSLVGKVVGGSYDQQETRLYVSC
jgi:hypothetical protein